MCVCVWIGNCTTVVYCDLGKKRRDLLKSENQAKKKRILII